MEIGDDGDGGFPHTRQAWYHGYARQDATFKPIAAARIPVVHVFGDADEVVAWEENTAILAERYGAFGGRIELFRKPGLRHHPHGPEDPAALATWVAANALP